MPRLSTKSQVTMEYLTLAIFVLSAMFLMGPYLIRSVNSYFQLTEEGIIDSMSEEFNQSSELTNAVTPGCVCTSWVSGDCAEGGCQKSQRLSIRTCDPAGCDISRKCDTSTNCCEQKEGLCGGSITDYLGTFVTCSGTEILYYRDCGTDGIHDAHCESDPIFCSSSCIGGKDDHADWCPNSLLPPIPASTATTYVDQTAGCPAPGTYCVAICDVGYEAAPTTGCVTCGNGCCDDGVLDSRDAPGCENHNASENCGTCSTDCGICCPGGLFCFNNDGCIKCDADCATFNAGSSCTNAGYCTPPTGITAPYSQHYPLDNRTSDIIAFCQALGWSSGSLVANSYTDACGWVMRYSPGSWYPYDEGGPGNRIFAYRIQCTP